jgi:hypothetical protein
MIFCHVERSEVEASLTVQFKMRDSSRLRHKAMAWQATEPVLSEVEGLGMTKRLIQIL